VKHREYQPNQQCLVFLTRVIFTMSIFSTVVCPHCVPGIGGHNANFGGTLKKFPAFALEFVCAPNFKTVSATMLRSLGANGTLGGASAVLIHP